MIVVACGRRQLPLAELAQEALDELVHLPRVVGELGLDVPHAEDASVLEELVPALVV